MVRQTKRPHAFTLIELLVVVSIIALLVSILMPALGRARMQARRLMCATRIRSIHQAAFLYATDDVRDQLPQGGYHLDGQDLDDSISLELSNYFKMADYITPVAGLPSDLEAITTMPTSELAKIAIESSETESGQIFMCPELERSYNDEYPCHFRREKTKFNRVLFNSWGSGWLARIGYCYLGGFETDEWDFNQHSGLDRDYVMKWRSPMTLSAKGSQVLATDRTRFCPGDTWGQGTAPFHELPHTKRGYAVNFQFDSKYDPRTQEGGTNVCAMDGSVTYKDLSETYARQTVQWTSDANGKRDLPHEDYTFF